MARQSKKETVIQPLVEVDGEVNALQALTDKGDAPELVSVGYSRLSGSSKDWVSYTIRTKGDKVLKVEVSEPSWRAIAEESAKIAFVSSFIDQE